MAVCYVVVDTLSSVSFTYAVAEEDWRNLRSLQELHFVDFNSLRISNEGATSLQSLSNLRQLSCFDCELPSGFLSQLRNANQLTILQVFNCKVADLVGLGELPNLRTLNLQQTRAPRCGFKTRWRTSTTTELISKRGDQ